MKALGLIDALGLSTAVSALDAACKAADVSLIGVERTIGAGGMIGVTINLAGDVAAVKAAVDAGVDAGNRAGKIISSHVIPRPHDELEKMIKKFQENLIQKDKEEKAKKEDSGKDKK